MREYFNGVKAEWKKIIWPSKNDMVKKTTAVVAVSVVLGTIISIADMGFQNIINFLTGLL